ncbi:sulfatase family protein [Aeoliella mucimassa]|uniref:Choline-sulfatase n=1 Tax=Aeoliella mucimassa TaxID=2527972 RepID=A0A518AMU9_9BACT|nr:sulfatase [Aeoliella mucimassa]QDU56021.1 Choline-sulfatase [Aeoliella mucimassa]
MPTHRSCKLGIILILLVLPLASLAWVAPVATAGDRPNFLLIVADDLTWTDLGYEGNSEVHTPNLDQLCQESMHLTGMFTPATTCSPSRNALYTGLYPIRSGAYPNHTRVYEGTKSVFTLLKQAGYRVALQNKSHVGPPSSFPYEHIEGADDLTETEAFVRRSGEEPWLLVYASNDPHGPWTRGPKKRFKPAELTVPLYLHDNQDTRRALANYYAEITKLDNQVGNLLKLLDDCEQSDNTLVVFVSEQGSSFPYGGKWSLYDNGIRVSTLVRWPGKVQPDSTSDALMQYVDVVPTFLEAAGIDPTTIDVGCPDAKGATGYDGQSFLGILTGKQQHLRDYIFSQHTTVGIHGYDEPYPMRAVRDSRYKLILNLTPQNTYSIGGIHKHRLLATWQADAKHDAELQARIDWLGKRPAEELYDLESDPLETHNLADDPGYTEIKQRLRAALDEWMHQQGDQGLDTEMAAKSRQGPSDEEKKAAAP